MKKTAINILIIIMLVLLTGLAATKANSTSEEECRKRVLASMDNARALGQNEYEWGQRAAFDCQKERALQGAFSDSDSEGSSAGDNGFIGGGMLGLMTAFFVFWIIGTKSRTDQGAYTIVKWLSGGLTTLMVLLLVSFSNSTQGAGFGGTAFAAAISFALPHGLLLWWTRKSAIQSNAGDRGSEIPGNTKQRIGDLESSPGQINRNIDPEENDRENKRRRVRHELLGNTSKLKNLTVAQIVDLDGTSRRSVVAWLARNELSCKDYARRQGSKT